MDKQTQKNLLNLVKRNYKEIAENFSETRKKYLWPELIKLTQNVKNGDKVLDVGCGNGRLLQAFLNKRISYVGMDSSEKLIDLAQQKNWKLEVGSWKFIKGDILELDEINKTGFDHVFCIAALHQIPGKDLQIQALKQLKNKVKPDGKIIITVWNLWSQKKFRKLIWKFVLLKLIGKNKIDYGDILFDWKDSQGERVSQRYYHAFTKSELKKIVKKARLKIERIYKDEFNYYAILTK
ncbi:MAG: class I SAM-dependent methyltransferase [Patescibacteria group bacterium]|nr:class I SAM-dependent methyltransferase [Patescibacteria group bacterium]